jgi:hypothetical protein
MTAKAIASLFRFECDNQNKTWSIISKERKSNLLASKANECVPKQQHFSQNKQNPSKVQVDFA